VACDEVEMILNISFNRETEAQLGERARISGKSIDEIVQEIMESRFAKTANQATAPEERVRIWKEFVASHVRREGVNLDDRREAVG
jgi:hypothetical protein